MKPKHSLFLVTFLLLVGLAVAADASLIVAYPSTGITIANNATTAEKLGGDITIVGQAADMVAGSRISLICPSGLKFDTAVPLVIGSNVNTSGFSVSPYTGTGYNNGYSNDGKTIKLSVLTAPEIPNNGTVKFRSTTGINYYDLAVLPSNREDTSIDTTGLQFSVVTNEDTAIPVTTTIGTINILKVPTILSARFTDATHFTIQFNCNIDSSTATGHSTALGTGKDLSSILSRDGLYVGNADTSVVNTTVVLDGSDPTKVNVSIIFGAIRTDGTSTVQTTTNEGGQFVNAKDPQTVPTITSLHPNAVHKGIPIYEVTLIELTYFIATPYNKMVFLEWTTESEIDNAGFNLYRAESEDGDYVKINDSLILAEGSPTQGATYQFIDEEVRNRRTYYYMLEDIDLNGTSTMHGLVSVMPRLMYSR